MRAFAEFLGEPFDEAAGYAALRRGETIGRPIGDETWLKALEARTGRTLTPGRRGQRPAAGDEDHGDAGTQLRLGIK